MYIELQLQDCVRGRTASRRRWRGYAGQPSCQLLDECRVLFAFICFITLLASRLIGAARRQRFDRPAATPSGRCWDDSRRLLATACPDCGASRSCPGLPATLLSSDEGTNRHPPVGSFGVG
eukprot:7377926-Prymnesium_polylepis.1